MGSKHSKSHKNKQFYESVTNNAAKISESSSDRLYNSIVRIKPCDKDISGTGFFIKLNIKGKIKFFLASCNDLISKDLADKKREIDIYYGKINKETKKTIRLDSAQRYIRIFGNPIDVILIEIIKKDDIPEDKYLYPDFNYKNGYNIYESKVFYLAGYPLNKNERFISSGKIKIISDFELEHTLDTSGGSSGSPICLSENLNVVGIHLRGDKSLPVNYGTLLGYIIDIIDKEDYSIEEKKEEETKGKNEEDNEEEEQIETNEEEDKFEYCTRINCKIYLNYNGEYSSYNFENPLMKVRDLKGDHSFFGESIKEQRLFYKDKELMNDELLKKYNSKKLDIYFGIEKGILIKMRRISGEILNLSLPQKIELAKQKIG
jgi:hypothetical protein